jgi:hypothetical protein
MPDGPFESLRLELLKSGVAPLHVDRTVVELREHFADLESAAIEAGYSAEEAARSARAALGSDRAIAAAILAQPALLRFSTRWPRVALLGTLPGWPLIYCLEHRPELARWGVAISVATTIMGSVLATLNWLIVLF